MVSQTPITPQRSGRRRKGMLGRKLLRDMRRSGMQFIAMVLLCMLGSWVFSGLDANWRMIDLSTESYLTQGNLADFWIHGSAFTKQDILRIEHLPGVDSVLPRVTLEMDVADIDEVSLNVNAYHGDMSINKPLLRQGALLEPSDLRGCLIEEQYAQAQNLSVGDTIRVTYGEIEKSFVIRGIVLSAEYLLTAKDKTPDPLHYGFMLVSAKSMAEFPFTELLIDMKPGADAAVLENTIQNILPTSLIISQKTHASTVMARNFTSIFRSMTLIFPVLAFAIAAMIVVNTLTRMIENQRVQMGTLKALGYSDRKIRNHYLAYALYPSLVGSLIGLFTGQWSIPAFLWPMVGANLRFPQQLHAPISLPAWIMAGVSVLLSVLICLHTYRKAAKETTASLLRPKPPKAGNRILLERIPGLWRRFSFNSKMIIRNLLRNKGRTCITLVGMLCCNMLIICTLGLQESIDHFVSQYYYGTLDYDVRIDLNQQAGTLESYQARLDAEAIDGIMEKSVSIHAAHDSRAGLITVLKDRQTTMRLGAGQTIITLPREGAAISRKLADTMGISLGDTVTVYLTGDPDPFRITIAEFCDTNVGQGVFMSETAWNKCRKGGFTANALLLREPTELTSYLLTQMDEVAQTKTTDSQYRQTISILDSTALAFSILSAVALGLAFIICYNMGLMNFTERTRDYATLKVLGYHQREIRRLMLRERELTGLFGAALGIFPGIALTHIILQSIENDSMVYVAHVSPQSILIASVVTFVFTWGVEWVLTRKVRSIDMVEALKSVE